ncbi:MAG: hypothetical protein EOO23_03810, partial [Comamonadaceae bacterium]
MPLLHPEITNAHVFGPCTLPAVSAPKHLCGIDEDVTHAWWEFREFSQDNYTDTRQDVYQELHVVHETEPAIEPRRA